MCSAGSMHAPPVFSDEPNALCIVHLAFGSTEHSSGLCTPVVLPDTHPDLDVIAYMCGKCLWLTVTGHPPSALHQHMGLGCPVLPMGSGPKPQSCTWHGRGARGDGHKGVVHAGKQPGGRGPTRGPGLPFGSKEGFRGFEFAYFPAHRAWKTRLCIFFSTQSAENSTLQIFLNTERRKLEFRFFLQRRASKTRLCILVFF